MTTTRLPDQELAGHLFQHFDSRGGSYLLIGYETDQQAKEAYVKTAYEGMDDLHADLIRNLDDPSSDFGGAVKVFVWGASITPDDVELLVDYGGKWHGIVLEDKAQVLLVEGDKEPPHVGLIERAEDLYNPATWFVNNGFPQVNPETAIELGEDAFGCILVWNPNARGTA